MQAIATKLKPTISLRSRRVSKEVQSPHDIDLIVSQKASKTGKIRVGCRTL